MSHESALQPFQNSFPALPWISVGFGTELRKAITGWTGFELTAQHWDKSPEQIFYPFLYVKLPWDVVFFGLFFHTEILDLHYQVKYI